MEKEVSHETILLSKAVRNQLTKKEQEKFKQLLQCENYRNKYHRLKKIVHNKSFGIKMVNPGNAYEDKAFNFEEPVENIHNSTNSIIINLEEIRDSKRKLLQQTIELYAAGVNQEFPNSCEIKTSMFRDELVRLTFEKLNYDTYLIGMPGISIEELEKISLAITFQSGQKQYFGNHEIKTNGRWKLELNGRKVTSIDLRIEE